MAGTSVFAEYPGAEAERPTGQDVFLVVLRAYPLASPDALDEAWRAAGILVRREVRRRRAVEVKDGVRPTSSPEPRKPRDPLSGAAVKRAIHQTMVRHAGQQAEG